MSLSRRAFVRNLTGHAAVPTAEALADRGREAWFGENWPLQDRPAARGNRSADAIRLNSNENPLGPGPSAIRAIEAAFVYAGRYPMNARPAMADFRALVAKKLSLPEKTSVSLGAGSGEILDNAVRAFTSSTRGLVAGLPTYEAPARVARQLGMPVKEIPVDARGKLDIEKMIEASTGAGLVFVCNPNNPTATVHSAKTITDLVARITKASPETVILVDEAYHEYVTDPSYATAVPMVSEYRNLIISRTLSKAHGMAALRLGYAVGQSEVISKLARWAMPYNANALAVAAGSASLEDEAHIARERERNTASLKFTLDFFRSAGIPATESQANFIWLDLGRPAREFREACEKQDVLVGRSFPPLDKTHCRISIATMEEMQRALGVFRTVLGVTTTTAATGRR